MALVELVDRPDVTEAPEAAETPARAKAETAEQPAA
jgi:hypothetical protein